MEYFKNFEAIKVPIALYKIWAYIGDPIELVHISTVDTACPEEMISWAPREGAGPHIFYKTYVYHNLITLNNGIFMVQHRKPNLWSFCAK